MRGRTNIPPRMGGIVNGVVREFQVSEENGISVGDYVEFGKQNSDCQDLSIVEGSTDWKIVYADIKNFARTGANRFLELSNGEKVLFFLKPGEPITLKAKRISILDNTTLSSIEQDISIPLKLNTLAAYFFVTELGNDKFLLTSTYQEYRNDPYIPEDRHLYLILTFNAVSSLWGYEELTLINESTKPNMGGQWLGVCKLSGNRFGVLEYTKNEGTGFLCLELDESSSTLTIDAYINLSTNSMYFCLIGVYNEYAVIQSIGSDNTLYSIETSEGEELSVTNSFSGFLLSGKSLKTMTQVRISETMFLNIEIKNNSSNSNTLKFNMYVGIVEITDNGQIVKYENPLITQSIQRTIESSFYANQLQTLLEYRNGVLFGEIREYTTSSSSSSASYLLKYRTLFSIPLDISDDYMITVGQLSNSEKATSYENLDTNKTLISLDCIGTEGDIVLFGGSDLVLNPYLIYAVKPTKNGLSSLFSADLIRKYRTSIIGIAKTAGANGEMIEVYSPE